MKDNDWCGSFIFCDVAENPIYWPCIYKGDISHNVLFLDSKHNNPHKKIRDDDYYSKNKNINDFIKYLFNL